MTLAQFNNGYWYAAELKSFAKSIGITFTNRLRKDELEHYIKRFLKTGKVEPDRLFLTLSGAQAVTQKGCRAFLHLQ